MPKTRQLHKDRFFLANDVSGSFTAFEAWTSTLGVNFSKETGLGTLLRIYGETTFPLWVLGTLDVRLENNQYTGGLLQASDYNQSRFSVSLIKVKNQK